LRRKIASTRRDIAHSVRDTEREFGRVLNPLVWVEKYPWRTTVFAALASWQLTEKAFDADPKAPRPPGETEPPAGLLKTLSRIFMGELAIPLIVNRIRRIANEFRKESLGNAKESDADATAESPAASE
jgi:hypothetical protein